jgi:hypothetical protein
MKGNGHEKTDSSDSNRCDRQFSLFPRPRTAHGGEALPQSPLPPPPPAPADRPLPPLPPSKLGTAEVIEVKQVETKKGKKTGFVQFSAFFKATFRFGKKVRSVAHAA